MHRPDRLDSALATRFAWWFVAPGSLVDVSARLRDAARTGERAKPAPVVRHVPVSPSDVRPAFDRARRSCGPLAEAIRAVFAEGDVGASLAGTKNILSRSARLRGDIAGMQLYPSELVALLRLVVRHGERITRRQRERAAALAMFVPLDVPQVVDLVVEIARAGDRLMAEALLSDEDAPGLLADGLLVARLVDVLEQSANPAACALTVDLLELARVPQGSIVPLRRALSASSFGTRARAFHALALARPVALSENDVLAALRDPLINGLRDSLESEEQQEAERRLAEGLLAALAQVRPAAAEEALLDLIDADFDSLWLDAGWATEALAACFPVTGAVMVDHWLKCAHVRDRLRALPALRRLPGQLAEPRLALAASDPACAVRDDARAQWLARFGRPNSTSAAELVGGALLSDRPSDLFLSRLAVMQSRVAEARAAMARALLAEPANAESLVLLLQFIADNADSGEPFFGTGSESWAARVVAHFGGLGVEGLCALARRFPEPETFGWLRRLDDLVQAAALSPQEAEPVRRIAAEHLASEDAGRFDDAMRVLGRVGAPTESFDRLVALALSDELGSREARAQITSWPTAAIDRRLAWEMAASLADRNWPRLTNASAMALSRGIAAARVFAQRVLELAESEPAAVEAAVECARHLRAQGALDEAWAVAAVANPQRPLFAVAARLWADAPSVRQALIDALTSNAREGASAVEAAIALLEVGRALSPRDRRLLAVLEFAKPAHRARLVYTLCAHRAPLASLARHLEELLVSPDPEVAGALVGVSAWLTSRRGRAFLRALVPHIVDVELRADVEEMVGPVAPA